MKKIMIRADDLGYSEAINYGIVKSVKDGIINNVGFMVNMPASRHGYDLIKDEQISLGQHTNVCVGKPLCDPSLIPSLVQENGEFKTSREYRSAKKDFVVFEEAILEVEAQYQRFKEITGKEPAYFEGHAIASENFLKALEFVAKQHQLTYQDVSFDGTPTIVNGNKVYMWMDSTSENYNPKAYFKYVVENAHEDGYDLLIFHPGYLDDYILKHSSLTLPRTLEVEASCDEDIKKYIKDEQIKLYKYEEL